MSTHYKRPNSELGKWIKTWFCCSLFVGSIVSGNTLGIILSLYGIYYYIEKYVK